MHGTRPFGKLACSECYSKYDKRSGLLPSHISMSCASEMTPEYQTLTSVIVWCRMTLPENEMARNWRGRL